MNTLDAHGVEVIASQFNDIEADLDMRMRESLVALYEETDDPVSRLAAFSLVVAGAGAPEKFAAEQAEAAVVTRAIEDRQLVVMGKAGGHSMMLHAGIPLGGLSYDYRTWWGQDLLKGKGRVIKASSGFPTFYNFYKEDKLAHKYAYIGHKEVAPSYDEKYLNEFFAEGTAMLMLASLGAPESGSVWRDYYVKLFPERADKVHIETAISADPLCRINSLDGLTEALEARPRLPVDQIRVIDMLAAAIDQARRGEEWGYGDWFFKDSATLAAGPSQFVEGENLSDPVKADIETLTAAAKTIEPKTVKQAKHEWFERSRERLASKA